MVTIKVYRWNVHEIMATRNIELMIAPPTGRINLNFTGEIFGDRNVKFSCTGNPGYPNGNLIWKVKFENKTDFQTYSFNNTKRVIKDENCVRTETLIVEHNFTMAWHGAKVICEESEPKIPRNKTQQPNEVEVFLMPRELFFTGAEGYIGDKNLSITCSIVNFTSWNNIIIYKNNISLATLHRDGSLDTTVNNPRNFHTDISQFYAYVAMRFPELDCYNKGSYKCEVDEGFTKTALVNVKSSPSGVPKLDLKGEIQGGSDKEFTCTGYPGYPDGHLVMRVKFENETQFKDYVFNNTQRIVNDDDCVRYEEIKIQHNFTMEWNGAEIMCEHPKYNITGNIDPELNPTVVPVEILLLKRSVTFTGVQGYMHEANLSLRCDITNFTRWEEIVIQKDNNTVASLDYFGSIKSTSDSNISIMKEIQYLQATMLMTFRELQCQNEGNYSCLVDKRYKRNASVIVKTLPTGTPKLNLNGNLFGNTNTSFTCTGNPGYPDGELTIKVKLENDTNFQSYEFNKLNRITNDADCIRTERLEIEHAFDMKWHGAKIICENSGTNGSQLLNQTTDSNDTSSVEILLMPRDLTFLGTEGYIGNTNLNIQCSITNFTKWNKIEIKKGNKSIVILGFHGDLESNIGENKTVIKKIDFLHASISVFFNPLQCDDQGQYSCAVDGRYKKQAEVTVKSPPKGKPKLNLKGAIHGHSNVSFSCKGYPGYPNGSLIMKVKFENDSEFRNHKFDTFKRVTDDMDCIRREIIQIEHNFSHEWNGAEVLCLNSGYNTTDASTPGGNDTNKVEIIMLNRKLDFTGTEGYIGEKGLSLTCQIYNFTKWDTLKIEKGNHTFAELSFDGAVLSKDNDNVTILNTVRYLYASLKVEFKALQCDDEGEYRCTVDDRYPEDASVVVKSLAEGSPNLNLNGNLYGDTNQTFTCTGNPGYPEGRLILKVKFENDTDYQEYGFENLKRSTNDVDCIRSESITVTHKFDMKWHGANIVCVSSAGNQSLPHNQTGPINDSSSVEVLLMPRALTFIGTEGFLGDTDLSIKCVITNFTKWNSIKISKNNQTVVQTYFNGDVVKEMEGNFTVDRNIRYLHADVTLNFKNLECDHEGTYSCSVDNRYEQAADVIVKSPPTGKPEMDLKGRVYGNKAVKFSCTGYPGYPDGKLLLKVKFENETEFHPYKFDEMENKVTDTDCERQETIGVKHTFDMSWNGAKVVCETPGTNNTTGQDLQANGTNMVEIILLERDLDFTGSEGYLGETGLNITCEILNFTRWDNLVILHDDKMFASMNFDGVVMTTDELVLNHSSEIEYRYARLSVHFPTLECEHEGHYVCKVDNKFTKEAEVIVKSKPVDDTTLDLNGEIFGDKNVNFSCHGYPGYPDGKLIFLVKFENDTQFKEHNFPVSQRDVNDRGCVRQEIITVNHTFDQKWHGAEILCRPELGVKNDTSLNDTQKVEILIMPRDLTLTSADGNLGDTNISIQCSIFNFTRWDQLVISHGNSSLAALDFNGDLSSDLSRNISVIQYIKYLHTSLTVEFNMFECDDGGEYSCSVDGRYTKRSSVIVKSPPSGTPVLDLDGDLSNKTSIQFTCTGKPGYPGGELRLRVKYENKTEYEDHVFTNIKRIVNDVDCIREETVSVEYNFTSRWNGAKLLCQSSERPIDHDENKTKEDNEVEIVLMQRDLQLTGINNYIGSQNLNLTCSIYNFTRWGVINIEKDGVPFVMINSDRPSSVSGNDDNIVVHTDIKYLFAKVKVMFKNLTCDYEGTYTCSVDNRYSKKTQIVTKTPPKGTPKLDLNGNIFGSSNVEFTCSGIAGYPNGSLAIKVKLENDTTFRKYDFKNMVVERNDTDCIRHEIIRVKHHFTMPWNGAKIICENSDAVNSSESIENEVEILLLPRGIFFSGTEGLLKQQNLSIQCHIENFTKWDQLEISRGDKPVVTLTPDGRVQSNMSNNVVVDHVIRNFYASLTLRFNPLDCEFEGPYTCTVDKRFSDDADVIVKSLPQGQPDLDLKGQIFGNTNSKFTCSGQPGYPAGQLDFRVKFENDTEYRPYKFKTARREINISNCIKYETVHVDHNFTLDWNGAKVICHDPKTMNESFPEESNTSEPVEIVLLKRDLSFQGLSGFIDTENLSIICAITNFTKWSEIVISKNGKPIATVEYDGTVSSVLHRNASIVETIEYLYASVKIKFNPLLCVDEGNYTCTVDQRYSKQASVIVKRRPDENPILDLNGTIYGDRNVKFSCKGYPGYPVGNLEWKVKLENESSFRSYEFPVTKRTVNTTADCIRHETVTVEHNFGIEWNGAKIVCVPPGTSNNDSVLIASNDSSNTVEILLMPKDLTFTGIDDFMGSENVNVVCSISNFTTWDTIEIIKSGNSFSSLTSTGQTTPPGENIPHVIDRNYFNATLMPLFTKLECSDEGEYSCSVDGKFTKSGKVIVRTPPRKNPSTNLPRKIYGDRTVTFSCSGYPGYPEGKLGWIVKFPNETKYHRYEFDVKDRKINDSDCIRKEDVTVEHDFTLEWHGAKIKCVEPGYNESVDNSTGDGVEVLLMPRDLQFTGIEGYQKDTNVIMNCNIRNFTHWNRIEIKKKGSTIITLKPDGQIDTMLDARVKILHQMEPLFVELSAEFSELLCEDEGDYSCSVDGQYGQNASIVVKTLPKDKPTLDLKEEIYNTRSVQFTCRGMPGYPNGNLTWKVKFDNETEYREYEFENSVRLVNDSNCERHEMVTVNKNFTIEWNGASIMCVEPGSNGTTDALPVKISFMPRELTFIGVDGFLRATNLQSVCSIENFTYWDNLVIKKENIQIGSLSYAGSLDNFSNNSLIPDVRDHFASLTMSLDPLKCEDEGTYTCFVDEGKHASEAKIIVRTPSRGKPKLQLDDRLYGKRNVNFSCSGYPGYPNGELAWKVKFQKENEFKNFSFDSAERFVEDINCIRHERVEVHHEFSLKWNGATIRCETPDTNDYDEVQIWLMQKDLEFTGATGNFGESSVTSTCGIYNFTAWNLLQIRKNDDVMATLTVDGQLKSWYPDLVSVTKNISSFYSSIDVTFDILTCEHEGTYTCNVDGSHGDTADVIVKRPASEKPKLQLDGNIFGDRNVTFSCLGYPGYPDGQLQWKVKYERDPEFQDVKLNIVDRLVNDSNCYREEELIVNHLFDLRWNGARLRCQAQGYSDLYDEVVIWLMPRGLEFAGTEGLIGEKATGTKCQIMNFTKWDTIEIKRDNISFVSLSPDGVVKSSFSDHAVVTEEKSGFNTALVVNFNQLTCKDEGNYTCSVDRKFIEKAEILVKNPPKSNPTLALEDKIYGDRNVTFTCVGNPGYPHGHLEWSVKYESETEFKDYNFEKITREWNDANCVRQEIVTVTQLFSVEWNGATIRCKAPHSDFYDKVQIWLMPRSLDLTGTEGLMGKTGQGYLNCSIFNFTYWNQMKIVKDNNTMVSLTSEGAIKNINNGHWLVKNEEHRDYQQSLTVEFSKLQCSDEGRYTCSIDGGFTQTAGVIVTSPPQGTPKLVLHGNLLEQRNINFTCSGKPGYPYGKLKWKVKFENQNEYKDFDFVNGDRKVDDVECVRSESFNVNYEFTLDWNGAWLRCEYENTSYATEVQIWLMQKDLSFSGIKAERGSVVSTTCQIYNYTSWREMAIMKNDRKIIRLHKDGNIESTDFNHLTVTPEMKEFSAGIHMKFDDYLCEDEGTYTCVVDEKQNETVKFIVETLPKGKPVLDFDGILFGDRRKQFSCTGYPGYPNGSLEWKIKLEREQIFREFQFENETRTIDDTDCERREAVHIDHLFTIDWNGALLRCSARGSDDFVEIQIWLMPRDLSFSSIDGFMGDSGITAQCNIHNFTTWNEIAIHKNSHSIIRFTPDGKVDSNVGTNLDISTSVQGYDATVFMKYNNIMCDDEGVYTCSVDSMFPENKTFIVRSQPKGKPILDLKSQIYGSKQVTFTCEGYPGYPYGQLIWLVKFEDTDNFQEIEFNITKRIKEDVHCVRRETVTVDHLFTTKWNGAKIRCQANSSSSQYEEVQIWLMPRDLTLTGVEGYLGSGNLSMMCSIKNFTYWQEVNIMYKNQSYVGMKPDGSVVSQAHSDSQVESRLHDGLSVLEIQYKKLRCEDEGEYSCSVDGKFTKMAEIVVKTPPVGQPKLNLQPEIFGDRNVKFSCDGRPSYPNGHLTFEVKFEKDNNFKPYRFLNNKSVIADNDCVRHERVTVNHHFTIDWNGAVIRCRAENGTEFSEVQIWLMPKAISFIGVEENFGRAVSGVFCRIENYTKWDTLEIMKDNSTIISLRSDGVINNAVASRVVAISDIDTEHHKVTLDLSFNPLDCEDEGKYLCIVDQSKTASGEIIVKSPPAGKPILNLEKHLYGQRDVAFTCTGNTGYPYGHMEWMVKFENESELRKYEFPSTKRQVDDVSCKRQEVMSVQHLFTIEWNGAVIRCQANGSNEYAEVQIWLMPKELALQGIDDNIGVKDALLQCQIKNFTNWNTLQISKNGQPVATLSSSDVIDTKMDPRAVVTSHIDSFNAGLRVQFSELLCEDEGNYSCQVDGTHKDEATVIVRTTPTTQPKLQINSLMYSQRHQDFTCTGKPGYPNGYLIFEVKFETDDDFNLYEFANIGRDTQQSNCEKLETLFVSYDFSLKWNGAKLRCRIANSSFYDEAQIWLMPRDLFFTGAEGYLNQTDLTATCFIKNFTHWNKLEIFKEDEPAVTLYRNGEYNSSLGNVIVSPDMKHNIFYYAINILFTTLSCSDKGQYSCAVDGQFIKETTVVVKTLPVGKPKLDLNGTIFGDRNVEFSCTGYTGYPVGKLKWTVQFETDTEFKKYNFVNTIREQHETNCYQKQTKSVTHNFDIKWNGAKLRCQAENSTDYDEVQIWLMPRDLFFNGAQGFEGSTGLLAKCSIQNFTHWDTIEILKNHNSVVTYRAGGQISSNLDAGVSVIPTSKPDDFYNDVELRFNNLRCDDEATYTCNVDKAFAKQAKVTVITPPKGKPTINLKNELFDNWDATFSCHGNSGYPNGSLGWKVKYEKASKFIDFEFENMNRQATKNNCQRTETLQVQQLFSLDWNGAVIRCQAKDSEEFAEVQIWLVPKGISFTGTDDYLGTKNLISECVIQNFTEWHQLTVAKDNKPLVTLFNNGSLTDSLPENIVASEERKQLEVVLSLRLNELKCQDEGDYVCSVDNELTSTTSIKVKTKPKGTPKLNLDGNIFGNRDVTFSCTGYPGYPDGKLKWHVKFERDTEFRDYEFPHSTRTYDDRGCEHFETVTVRNLFTIDWNGATLRCMLPSGTEYAEVQIWLMPRDLVLTDAVGLLDSKTTHMTCSIYNFTTWDQVEIFKNNGSIVTLINDGTVNYAAKRIPTTPTIKALTADLKLNFDQLSCDDEGEYACSVDGMFMKSSRLTVKTLPQGKPQLDLQSNIFGDRNVAFTCKGHPAYPDGKMIWRVKWETDQDFRDFEFPDTTKTDQDVNCQREETISVRHLFTISWNGAIIRCQHMDTDLYDEVQIWLLPRDLFFTGIEGFIGETNLVAKCNIENFTLWNELKISKENQDLVQLRADGNVQALTPSTVKVTEQIQKSDYKAAITMTYTTLTCDAEGTYTCEIDNRYKKETKIIVKGPPVGKPNINLDGNIFGNRNVKFSCKGKPSYPYGKLVWKLKLENENDFKDFNFLTEKRTHVDNNCEREETIEVEHEFQLHLNGAKLRCQADNSTLYDEVEIWLLKKDLTMVGSEGKIGSKGMVECKIQNFTRWNKIELSRNNAVVGQLTYDQQADSTLSGAVISHEVRHSDHLASIKLTFDQLKCGDEGTYSCSVDGGHLKSANLSITTPPTGKPTLDLNGNIFGDRNVKFTCIGNPGYPSGKLKWKVKFETETSFRDFEFPNTKRNYDDKNCIRKETVIVEHEFTIDWNGATLRCGADGSTEYDEVDIWLMPRDLFFTGGESDVGTVLDASCNIQNFTNWGQIKISRDNRDAVILTPDGKVDSHLPTTISVTDDIRKANFYAAIKLKFTNIQCSDEGRYKCNVDNNFLKETKVVVKTPPKGKPKLNLNGEMYGNRNQVFSCQGNPGYPYGKLGFQVKFEKDATFRDYTFPDETRDVADSNCVRTETVNVKHTFTTDWNGAKLRCVAPGSPDYDEVEIWLLKKELGFNGIQGVIGQPAKATCYIKNFTNWQTLLISKQKKPAVVLRSNGLLQSGLHGGISVTKEIRRDEFYAAINFEFGRIACGDEGSYTCSVDNGFQKEASVAVITPPEGKPELSLGGEIFGERMVDFTCKGKPGYPGGQLEFKVKFKGDNVFSDHVFHSAVRQSSDQNCERNEVVSAEYLFTMDWSGAKVRCQAPGSLEYDEKEIWMMDERMCDLEPLNGKLAHPYTCRKFIICMEARLVIQDCPTSLCFDPNTKSCVAGISDPVDTPTASVVPTSCEGKHIETSLPHESDCSKYYLCFHGSKVEYPCKTGMYYAPEAAGYCVWNKAQSYCGRNGR